MLIHQNILNIFYHKKAKVIKNYLRHYKNTK